MPDKTASAVTNPDRLAALEKTGLLDSPPEVAFDRMTSLASKILQTPVALVSLVDHDRQFFKSATGLAERWAQQRETPLSHSFCRHVVGSNEPLIISDAREHPLVRDNLAIEEIGVVAYAGIPLITSTGQALGSFCAIDGKPREWTSEEIAILSDLASFAMTEIELRLAARQLQQNYEQLQKLETLRDDVTQMIVHDLRTPAGALLMGLAMVDDSGPLNTIQKESFDIALKSAQTLLGMVNDMLDISKMESGNLPLEYSCIEPAEIIRNAVAQIEPLVKSKRLEFNSNVAADLPSFEADGDKVLRALVNLLGNAIKFTPRDGCIEVAAEYDVAKDVVRFIIRDSGEGIALQDQEQIFDKFGQAAHRKSGRQMSTGLGLTFCKMAVEAHGGQISVESELGKGSLFRFELPRKKPI